MSSTPSHRWFSFSLRTAFVLLTLACAAAAWSAYQLNWIRQRHVFLSDRRSKPTKTREIGYTVCTPVFGVSAPGLLWMFGEQGEGAIYLDGKYSAEDAKRVEAMFPEARVVHICYETLRPSVPSQRDRR